MIDTSGFYKNEDGNLLTGPHYVLSGSYSLFRGEKDTYTYPVGGWYWFDSIEEACSFFQIKLPDDYIKLLEELQNG